MKIKNKENKLKVMSILGTRPEIIRLSRVLVKLKKYTNHIFVYTGQSYDYELSDIFFKELGLKKPNYYLNVKADTIGKQIAKIISKSEEVIKKEMPDALLILGDTNSTLSAIVAKRFKIPIFHMEAGNRCFDENVPEEINRKIIDHISDINLPYTEHSKHYLILEGIPPNYIFVTGSPLTEVLTYYQNKIKASKILEKLNLKKSQYFLVSIHREENIENEKSFSKIIEALNGAAKIYKLPLIVTTHPRTRKQLKKGFVRSHRLIKYYKPFGFFDYVTLEKNALCVISDSGTIQEESAILNFPAVQIRNSSERPEAFDAGTIILTGLDKDIILQSISIAIKQSKEGEKFDFPPAYKNTNVSNKVLRIIIGFSKIIKRKKYFW